MCRRAVPPGGPRTANPTPWLRTAARTPPRAAGWETHDARSVYSSLAQDSGPEAQHSKLRAEDSGLRREVCESTRQLFRPAIALQQQRAVRRQSPDARNRQVFDQSPHAIQAPAGLGRGGKEQLIILTTGEGLLH